eukprot:GHVU01108483.1.p1 GENE.GHVU01108483.1~~GHVU01108483.1.p1  ORF type:complete len:406 (+),score=101.62 GHVU01108483.1:713-1930(+)
MRRGKEDAPVGGGKTAVGRGGASGTAEGRRNKTAPEWQSTQKVTQQNMDTLDFSVRNGGGGGADAGGHADNYGADGDEESEEEEDGAGEDKGQSGVFSSMVGKIWALAGNQLLTSDVLAPALAQFKTQLMAKSVASEIAERITQSVEQSLLQQRTPSFGSVKATVKEAFTLAVKRLLTPTRNIDVLKEALEAKDKKKVYSVVFLGVNGVGKSTNLAKVCFYLKQKGGLKVLIAACDTFRAGAVEQLNVHAKNLDVELFQKGYGKDAATVAKDAIAHAAATGHDVVLIDTAGRMQDNEPLMRALAKLVHVNTPDLILFVGEALVGNDAVDQLNKFNQCLADMALTRHPRKIDGTLLTKFDAVGDKVGAALSMVFVTGQPIVFIGTGQRYPHLRRLDVDVVVKALLD